MNISFLGDLIIPQRQKSSLLSKSGKAPNLKALPETLIPLIRVKGAIRLSFVSGLILFFYNNSKNA